MDYRRTSPPSNPAREMSALRLQATHHVCAPPKDKCRNGGTGRCARLILGPRPLVNQGGSPVGGNEHSTGSTSPRSDDWFGQKWLKTSTRGALQPWPRPSRVG